MKLSDFKLKQEKREKKAFYSSDFGKPILDLYFGFKGIVPTNPTEWYQTMKFGAGKGVEESMLKVLKDSGFVAEDYDQKTHGRIEIEREGVRINGYIDAITKDGLPIEIKSINNKNQFDIAKYEDGKPRENYVGQLAIYMDALGVDTGYLLVSSIDGLNYFLFECKKIGERKYKCKDTEVDLDKEYKRWSKLYSGNIEKDIEPKATEYLYKYDINTIDWNKLSKTAISKARNNHAVVGDFQITYSPWADKIIEMQGTQRGYTEDEIKFIKEKTKGFSVK